MPWVNAALHGRGSMRNIGSSRCASAGSPTQPSARLANVMPSWVAASASSSFSTASRTASAPNTPALDQLLDPRPAHRHQRELGRDEEPVERDQHGHRPGTPASRGSAAWVSRRRGGYSTSRRPSSARASVTRSEYSRSDPIGTPRAMRVTLHAERRQQPRQVERGRLAGHVRVGGQDDLAHLAARAAAEQLADAQVLGVRALERRQRAAQHVIAAAELAGALERQHVTRLLDHAHQRAVALRVGADQARVRPR